ncbi:MAG: hypothetical protein ACREBW_04680, partial [Candidatus Micrarchaeaceae archaeon]
MSNNVDENKVELAAEPSTYTAERARHQRERSAKNSSAWYGRNRERVAQRRRTKRQLKGKIRCFCGKEVTRGYKGHDDCEHHDEA